MKDLTWSEMEARLTAAQARLGMAGAELALQPGELVIRLEVPSAWAACTAADAFADALAKILDLPEAP